MDLPFALMKYFNAISLTHDTVGFLIGTKQSINGLINGYHSFLGTDEGLNFFISGLLLFGLLCSICFGFFSFPIVLSCLYSLLFFFGPAVVYIFSRFSFLFFSTAFVNIVLFIFCISLLCSVSLFSLMAEFIFLQKEKRIKSCTRVKTRSVYTC